MKNIFTSFIVFSILGMASLTANAQDSSLRAILGFKSSAINIGADYEVRRDSNWGVGGYFFFGTDESEGNTILTPEVLALGGFMPIHFFNDDPFSLYLAPGFGIAMLEYDYATAQDDDETTFGPTIKLGAEYKASYNMKLGLQHFIITNWLSDEVSGEISYTNATATFAF